MKTKFNILTIALCCALSAISCKRDKKELGDKPSQTNGISGTWVLSRVDQIDVNVEVAFRESDTLLSVTEAILTGNPMEITFDKSSSNFTTKAGDGIEFFGGTLGSWAFDNANYPSKVILNASQPNEATYNLVKPVRPQDSYLVLKYNKMCGNQRTVSYHLWYSRK